MKAFYSVALHLVRVGLMDKDKFISLHDTETYKDEES